MKPSEVVTALEINGKVFSGILSEIPKAMIHWTVKPSDWSLLEMICHLVDEEREDFRARIKHTLETPNEPLKPIDPVGWAIQRNYLGQDFHQMLLQFIEERKKSVVWLKELKSPKWDNTVDHPELGEISAASFLFNWLAHDYHHIRQVNNLKHAYLKHSSGDSLTYAGKW